MGLVGSISPGTPNIGRTDLSGVTAWGGRGLSENVTVVKDPSTSIGVGRGSVRIAAGNTNGAGAIYARQDAALWGKLRF
jgi:hypothetical protein